MKKVLVMILCASLLLGLAGCGGNTASTQGDQAQNAQVTEQQVAATEAPTAAPTAAPTEAPTVPTTEAPTEVQYAPFSVGSTATSADWNINLTSAYTSTTLESSESSTYWEADSGYAFLVLEFDITCLNSNKPTIDGDAITDLVASTSDGNTYESWTYQYVSAQIWCHIRNTYLEANLPLHIYVYTYIPASMMNSPVNVKLNLAGQPRQITIN